jgi:hypothetical protein
MFLFLWTIMLTLSPRVPCDRIIEAVQMRIVLRKGYLYVCFPETLISILACLYAFLLFTASGLDAFPFG